MKIGQPNLSGGLGRKCRSQKGDGIYSGLIDESSASTILFETFVSKKE